MPTVRGASGLQADRPVASCRLVRSVNGSATLLPGWEVRVTSRGPPGLRAEPFPRDDFVMALRLVRPDDITVQMAHRPRSFDIRSQTKSSPIQTAVEVVGRGLAIGVGPGLLLTASPGATTLAVVGVLSLGSALLSWQR